MLACMSTRQPSRRTRIQKLSPPRGENWPGCLKAASSELAKAAWRYSISVIAFRRGPACAMLVHGKGKHHVSSSVGEGLKGWD